MHNFKKIVSLLLAFVMVFGVMAPVMATEVQPVAEETTTETTETPVKVEHKTAIVIHKIVMDKAEMEKHDDKDKTPKYDGTKITNIESYFTTGKEVAGVAFDIYQELETASTDTIAHDNPILGGKGVEGKFYKKVQDNLITEETGVTTEGLVDGAYIIVEDKEASTYTGEEGKAITESKAVPARIVLPMTKPDGTGLFSVEDPLHLYPKNTEEKPEIDKNFAKENELTEVNPGQTGKNAGAVYENYQKEKATATALVGSEVPYEVKTKIPMKSEYKTVRWEDTMTMGLTFNKDLKIFLDGKEFDSANYKLEENESGFVLTLNDTGLEALKTAAAEAKKDVEFTLTYTATINDSAVVDQADLNNIIFNYSNKPNEFKDPRENEVKPKEQKISVTKTWAEGDAPAGVTVKYYLYEKGASAAEDKVVGYVERTTETGFDYTFEKLDDTKTYYVKEIVAGYTPEYKVGEGSVAVTNTKDNENPKPLDPTEPKVVTYGKKFVKMEKDGEARLAGAEFKIANADKTQFLKLKNAADQKTELEAYQAAEKAYQEEVAKAKIVDGKMEGTTQAAIDELKAERDAAYEAMNNSWEWGTEDEAFVFTSGQNGEFEVKGLVKGTYFVKETKAPAGFALPSNEYVAEFTAGSGSYTSGDINYDIGTPDTKDAMRIDNTKVTIPQTGGIGTVIFTVGGIALMGGAAVAMKKNKEDEE